MRPSIGLCHVVELAIMQRTCPAQAQQARAVFFWRNRGVDCLEAKPSDCGWRQCTYAAAVPCLNTVWRDMEWLRWSQMFCNWMGSVRSRRQASHALAALLVCTRIGPSNLAPEAAHWVGPRGLSMNMSQRISLWGSLQEHARPSMCAACIMNSVWLLQAWPKQAAS